MGRFFYRDPEKWQQFTSESKKATNSLEEVAGGSHQSPQPPKENVKLKA
jgi:hypothetical protein